MKYALCLLVLVVVAAIFACTRAPKLIPREILFGNPEKAHPQISPDGTKIAYLAPVDGVINVWVRSREGGDDRPVTRDKGRGITNYFWLQDSRFMIFLQDNDGDENSHIFLTDIESNHVKDLTPFPGVKAQVLDGSKHFPDDLLVTMNRENPKAYDAYRLKWRTGELTLEAKNPGDISGWITDTNMKVRGAVKALGKGDYAVLVRESDSAPWVKVVEWGLEDNLNTNVHGFTRDGKSLLMTDSRDTPVARLIHLDLANGKKTVIAEDPESDALGAVRDPDTHEVQMVLFIKEKMEWKILDESIRPDIEKIRGLYGKNFTLAGRDNPGKTWLVRVESDKAPVAYYLFDRVKGESRFLFEHQPALHKYSLSAIEPISFKSRDGLTIHGYLALPPGKSRKNLPLVLKVHGGPWSRDVWGYDPRVQWITSRGYACLQVNYRGSTTYGKAFVNASSKEWGGKMQDDLTDAVQWAVKEGIADPKRVAIYGGSYGGYAALSGAVFTPDLYKAAISIVGPSNLISFIRSIPPYWTTELANIKMRIGDPDTEEDFLKSRSPLFHVDRIKIPMLIAQGANDPRVKKAESEQMVEAMKKQGLPVEYLLFPDEGHGFAKPENQMKFYKAAEKFLADHLGGRYEE